MRRVPAAFLVLFALAASSCSQNPPLAPRTSQPASPPSRQIDTAPLDRLERLAAGPNRGVAELARGHHLVVVPAGSHDALADAIAAAGPRGVVLLKSGSHTESATVTIGSAVTLIGESGAELVSLAGPPSTASPLVVAPALYVRANDVSILGLKIVSSPGDGSTAVLVQDARNALVFNNQMLGFQFGVLVARSDWAKVWKNSVVGSSGWQTGALGDVEDIIVISGSFASVLRNETSNGVFGIWPCGSNGQLAFNSAHDNFIGLIFCKVPAGAFRMPDGAVLGSDVSSTGWFATENHTVNNLTTGFLAIDGANHCLMASNASSGNGTYDIELAGDSFRFGFLTPTSHDMTFIAGRYPTVEVKNCGANNQIIGGALVDNTLEPCN